MKRKKQSKVAGTGTKSEEGSGVASRQVGRPEKPPAARLGELDFELLEPARDSHRFAHGE